VIEMVMLARLMAGTSGMTRNMRVLSPSPRISIVPGRRGGDSAGEGADGGRENGRGSTGRRVNRDAGTTSGLGLPVGKSGIGAPTGAPGMGLRVTAMPRGGRLAMGCPGR
jgi:hypothetical protein